MPAMEGALGQIADTAPSDRGGTALPARMRLLCVGSTEPSWISLALQLDALGCIEPSFRWVSTAGEALALLRDESFDCLLVWVNPTWSESNDGPLSLARGIRAGGCADPVVIVTMGIDDATWNEALQLNVDLLVSSKGWESSALIQSIQRAVERGSIVHEIDRLAAADRLRHQREREEADRLLAQQRRILTALDQTAASRNVGSPLRLPLPPEFEEYYQELLRTYVIMGSGNLAAEIAKLADLLCQAGLSTPQVLDFHLEGVEKLVRGLGNRSTRHVMSRADLLALELMVHVGHCYQQQAHARGEQIAASEDPAAQVL